jgi:hypothetical protein
VELSGECGGVLANGTDKRLLQWENQAGIAKKSG